MSERTLGKARGLNSIADPSDFKGSRGRREAKQAEPTPPPPRVEDHTGSAAEQPAVARNSDAAVAPDTAGDGRVGGGAATAVEAPVTPHRAVVPGIRRKRRELSVPVPVSEALAATGINPADVVMSAYRKHSDEIFAGAGGRLVSRGRERLRLSISDAEFDKLTRLGEARGWNRSETVAVLLTLELLQAPDAAVD